MISLGCVSTRPVTAAAAAALLLLLLYLRREIIHEHTKYENIGYTLCTFHAPRTTHHHSTAPQHTRNSTQQRFIIYACSAETHHLLHMRLSSTPAKNRRFRSICLVVVAGLVVSVMCAYRRNAFQNGNVFWGVFKQVQKRSFDRGGLLHKLSDHF